MTINQLHKLTGVLIAKGAGRRAVLIDKSTFNHRLESDGCLILPVESGDLQHFTIADDDGGTAFDSRGQEKSRTGLVFKGE